MDTFATRDLARIQSMLHVLRSQRDTLSELSDIQAFRGLEENFQEDLQEAQKRGLVPRDPVSVVLDDYRRLSVWSNRVQQALKEANDLGREIEFFGSSHEQETGKKTGKLDKGWRPSLADLQRLKIALGSAPRSLLGAMELARNELQAGDWSNGRPYPELAEVADAMDWTDKLKLAESPGSWAYGLVQRDRPLVASRLAVESGSSIIEKLLGTLREREALVSELLEQHAQQVANLKEVSHLISTGQLESAAKRMIGVKSFFVDVDCGEAVRALEKAQQTLIRFELESFDLMVQILGLVDALNDASFFRRGSAKNALLEGLSHVEVLKKRMELFVSQNADSESAITLSKWVVRLQQLSKNGIKIDRSSLRAEVGKLKDDLGGVSALKLGVNLPLDPGFRYQFGEIILRWVQAGHFMMGSPTSESNRDDGERLHKVDLTNGVFFAETECTQAQWEGVMGGNPSYFRIGGRSRPVEQVSWEEAMEFCRKLTAKQRAEGVLPLHWEWRLPTEAEWEYAARAGTTDARYWKLDGIAWYSGNSDNAPHPVSQMQANAWGLHDMLGNVWEWCLDWHGDYPSDGVTNPTGPISGSFRVVRGGSWNRNAGVIRAANRYRCVPSFRSNDLGFRPVLSSVR
jgi:hypothetical protein